MKLFFKDSLYFDESSPKSRLKLKRVTIEIESLNEINGYEPGDIITLPGSYLIDIFTNKISEEDFPRFEKILKKLGYILSQ